MKAIRQYFTVLLILPLLAGCSGFMQRAEIPTDPAAALKFAQDGINEANTTMTAVASVVAQNKRDGIYTGAERDRYVAKLREFAGKVDGAQAIVNACKAPPPKPGDPPPPVVCDPFSAANQAELLKTLIVALHREVAARARKQ